MKFSSFFLKCQLTILAFFSGTAILSAGVPQIGAQVIIEPGQSAAQIDRYFSVMQDCGMTCCRIRMFESYMHSEEGDWDFCLFDTAFAAAERHGVKVFATLFPSLEGNSVGGFKFPVSDEHKMSIDNYITAVVNHFSQHPALLGWVLINEPGTGGYIPKSEYSQEKYRHWLASEGKTFPEAFRSDEFLLQYNSWYISQLSSQVRSLDPDYEIHINNHQIFENIAEYDFPAWRQSLTSLGASAHPSWHFGYFERDSYALALGANCEIIRSGAGDLPYWITELQGGTNTYSGNRAFCPNGKEISQWLWTGVGHGVDGIIFWCLNPRGRGEEAGEWSLLDLQGNRSERSNAAADVTSKINANSDLFAEASPVEPKIFLAYTRESLWAEKKVQYGSLDDPAYEGRHRGGAMKSLLGFYEMFSELGIQTRICELEEFDWSRDDYHDFCIVLAGQVALPKNSYEALRRFVFLGGNLIVEGLSSFYDEEMNAVHMGDFALADLFGGKIADIHSAPGDRTVKIGPVDKCPVHLWDAEIADSCGNRTNYILNSYGAGRVLWIPAMVSLACRREGNYKHLYKLTGNIWRGCAETAPLRFARNTKGLCPSALQTTDGTLVTIITNGSARAKSVRLVLDDYAYDSTISGRRPRFGKTVRIEAGGTSVIHWKRK
ncbi:MAG: beta-galactosidase [Bacteroidales bacterium]|nr:beta-galactosidase [Candidatus Cryptobacteroides aphodequi]